MPALTYPPGSGHSRATSADDGKAIALLNMLFMAMPTSVSAPWGGFVGPSSPSLAPYARLGQSGGASRLPSSGAAHGTGFARLQTCDLLVQRRRLLFLVLPEMEFTVAVRATPTAFSILS